VSSKFFKRTASKIDLKSVSDINISQPETVSITIGKQSLDLGVICYSSIENRGLGVFLYDPSSLVKSRKVIVHRIIDYASSLVGELAVKSIHTHINNIRRFFLWAFENKVYESLEFEFLRKALVEYVEYLKENIRLGVLANNTCARYQHDVINFFKEELGYADIHLGIRLLKKQNNSVEHTESPCEEDQGKVLAIAQSLFYVVANAIKNELPFPLAIPVPPYLKRNNNTAWCFPIPQWTSINNDNEKNEYYDYENGCVKGVLKALNDGEKLVRAQSIAIGVIDRNNDYNNQLWLRLSALGSRVFSVLFTANTAMNLEQLVGLKWFNDNYETNKETQGFIDIKSRAGHRTVGFTITSDFIKTFDKYIEMRRKTVDVFGDKMSLFFSIDRHNKICTPTIGIVNSGIKSLRKLDPNLPSILSQKWRSAKSDYLVVNTDIHSTAEILQNTPSTVKKSYAQGTQKGAEREVGNFLEKLSGKVFSKNKTSQETSVSTGNCNDFGNPKPDGVPEGSVEPDCRNGEGCLFCSSYVLHADETDIRKLLSCQLCVESTSHLSASRVHFEQLYGSVLNRINELLDTVADELPEGNELVERIRGEVFEEGVLDPYWETKYEQLMELGVV